MADKVRINSGLINVNSFYIHPVIGCASAPGWGLSSWLTQLYSASALFLTMPFSLWAEGLAENWQ